MTASVVPSELVAGDTLAFVREYSDYPAPTWGAIAYFELGGVKFSATATASGSAQSFSVAAANTTDKTPGRYKWWIRVTNSGNAYTVEEGWLDIKPDPASKAQRDNRSTARQMLDAVNAMLLGKATNDQQEMTINGRSIKRIPLPELQQWRTQLRQEVRTEEGAERVGLGRVIKVRLLRG